MSALYYIIKSESNGFVGIPEYYKNRHGKWMKRVSHVKDKVSAVRFATKIIADTFIMENGIQIEHVAIKEFGNPILQLRLSEEYAGNLPIHTRDCDNDVYFITVNLGAFDDGEWIDTDEGFCGIESISLMLGGTTLLKKAISLGLFFDDDGWFFEDKDSASEIFIDIQNELIQKGWEITS